MAEKTSSSERDASLQSLQGEKAKRLAVLLKHKRTSKHYKQSLRAFLDADGALQQALLARLDASSL